MKKLFLAVITSFLFAHVGFSNSYVWEDYDDFSSSSLDTSKWEVGYWGGGQTVSIVNGQAQLSGSTYSSNSPIQVPSDIAAAASGSNEGNTFLFFKEEGIYGIQADIYLPTSNNSYEVGIYLASIDTNPLGSLGAELIYKTSGPVLFFDYLDSGNEWEHQETGSMDTFHQLQITKIDGKTTHYLNGNLIKQFESSSHDEDYWTIGAFNDNGFAYTTFADNVRVLRRVTTTSLDGSVLMLSSADDVSETLSFENGTFTSSFHDPTEGTFVDTDKSYILDAVSNDVWNITLEDGDTYSFDASTNSGTLVDYENGQIDTEGTWSFTFERHDWDDYDDFSGSSLDTSKWDICKWDGGEFPVPEGGKVKFTGQPNSSSSVNVATSAMLAISPDASVGDPSSQSPHSVLEFKDSQNLDGIELTFSIPSDVPDNMGFGLYAVDYQSMFSSESDSEEESAIRFNFDLWAENSLAATLEFDAKDPSTGVEQGIDKSISFDSYYRVSFIRDDSQISFYMNGELIGEFPYSDVGEYFIVRAMNQNNQPFTTYLENVRVLRRSQQEPDPVMVVSDPSGNPVVVQLADKYNWSDSLDGVTLWSVSGSESEGDWDALTAKFSGGKLIYGFEFADDVSDTGANTAPYEIDENGYIKSLEGDGDYQYYNVVSVEDGVIGTIQNDQGVESVADNGVNQVDQWFFTTRAAAEEFYYSKVNPKSWMWFDAYPWVYSEEENDWLYFHPSGGSLMYWSNKGQAWRKFN
jgi:hypothetical protein